MGFNYGSETRQFHRKWEKLRTEYAAAGMAESDIQAMYEYDWEDFKRERIFCMHNRQLEDARFQNGDAVSEDKSPFFKKHLAQFSCVHPEAMTWGRQDWPEHIDTPELARQLKRLSSEDMEFISGLVADDLSKAELARRLGISRAAVTQRCVRIKKFLEKFQYEVNK